MEGGRKREPVTEGGWVGGWVEEEEKGPLGISWPAAPSGRRHEGHFHSDRKSDSREPRRRDRKSNQRRTNMVKTEG